MHDDLLSDSSKSQNNFEENCKNWGYLGKQAIPMEVSDNDGNISSDLSTVLNTL